MQEGEIDDEVQWHLGDHMTHSYYLDTITSIKSTGSCFCDMTLIVFFFIWVMMGLKTLRDKNIIPNYHERWTIETL